MTSKEEYLKRYLSGDKKDEKKSKKKRLVKKKAETRFKIVEDDPFIPVAAPSTETEQIEEYVSEEEESYQPIIELIDNKTEELQMFGKFKTSSWQTVGEKSTDNARRTRHDSVETSPSRRQRQDSGDESPPRRRRQDSGDESPPRRQRHGSGDASPPRRQRHDSGDESPPRRPRNGSGDVSPPRRRRNDSDGAAPSLPQRRRNDSDSVNTSPPRRRRQDSFDASPSQRRRHDSGGPSPPRRRGNDSDGESASTSKPIQRNIRRKKKELTEEQKQRAAELAKKYAVWNKGQKQVNEREEKLNELAAEASKPFARHVGDEDLEDHLKKIEYQDDPMLEYMRQKKQKETGTVSKPAYKGPWPPNRYGIPPGYRWDGVDRSNGFEVKLMASKNVKKAEEEEYYKWTSGRFE